ncbi:MAG: nucleotidyltransferase domain-containing protein [Acidobacteria bacterium]|nr:nucleotidyltransferase domain-containing protein [Acidobacteriota bacterium]
MDLQQIGDQLRPVFESGKARKAIVFGSLARGTAERRSDLDLLVVDDEPLPYLRRLDKYYDAIVTLLHVPLDLFVYTSREFEENLELPFLSRVIKEGQVIYEP